MSITRGTIVSTNTSAAPVGYSWNEVQQSAWRARSRFEPNHNAVLNINHNAVLNINHNAVLNINHNAVLNINHNAVPNINHNTVLNINHNTVPNINHNTVLNLNHHAASNNKGARTAHCCSVAATALQYRQQHTAVPSTIQQPKPVQTLGVKHSLDEGRGGGVFELLEQGADGSSSRTAHEQGARAAAFWLGCETCSSWALSSK